MDKDYYDGKGEANIGGLRITADPSTEMFSFYGEECYDSLDKWQVLMLRDYIDDMLELWRENG